MRDVAIGDIQASWQMSCGVCAKAHTSNGNVNETTSNVANQSNNSSNANSSLTYLNVNNDPSNTNSNISSQLLLLTVLQVKPMEHVT